MELNPLNTPERDINHFCQLCGHMTSISLLILKVLAWKLANAVFLLFAKSFVCFLLFACQCSINSFINPFMPRILDRCYLDQYKISLCQAK